MVFIPQTFSYRLIIGSLIIALSVLGVFTIQNQKTLKEYNSYLAQEKKLIQNELSEMISIFDTIEVENIALSKQLEDSKLEFEQVLDSIKTLKVSANLLSHYRSKIELLKDERNQILTLVEKLEMKNKTLQTEAALSKQHLTTVRNLAGNLKDTNKELENDNKTLKQKIVSASQIQVTMLQATAVKHIRRNTVVTTDKAKKTNKLLVEFVIPKNNLVTTGVKEVYIQIVNPNNNVVSDKAEVKFGKQRLIYSKKLDVNFTNKEVEVSTFIEADKDEPFKEGVYFVNVFNKENRLASTSILLD